MMTNRIYTIYRDQLTGMIGFHAYADRLRATDTVIGTTTSYATAYRISRNSEKGR